MPKYGKRSRDNLATAHYKLQVLFKEVIKYYDCSILCCYRTKEDQDKAYKNGYSKLKYPKSKHNTYPSFAIDIAPYPIDWDNINRFYELAGVVKTVAKQMDIKLKWGGSWRWKDYPHYELA